MISEYTYFNFNDPSCHVDAHPHLPQFLPLPFKLVVKIRSKRWCSFFRFSYHHHLDEKYLLRTDSSILRDFLMKWWIRVLIFCWSWQGKCVDEPKFMKRVFVIKGLLYWVLLYRKHNAKSLLHDEKQWTKTTSSTWNHESFICNL